MMPRGGLNSYPTTIASVKRPALCAALLGAGYLNVHAEAEPVNRLIHEKSPYLLQPIIIRSIGIPGAPKRSRKAQ